MNDHISVCICTYKRPNLLKDLLSGLLTQKTGGFFDYSIIVVDNDIERSAEETVDSYRKKEKVEINYFVEEVKNISLARNRAVKAAKGNLIAFIDDDEYPGEDWLLNLFKIYDKYPCAGVSGPVHPVFEGGAPEWIKKIKFYYYGHNNVTGKDIEGDFHTGNALINKEIFKTEADYFDPAFGSTGGEDTDFFLRMLLKGYNFKWCSEARVSARFTQERCRTSWLLKRYFRSGGVSFKLQIRNLTYRHRYLLILRHFSRLFVYSCALPLMLLRGKNIFIQYLMWDFFEVGFFLAIFGYVRKEYA